MKLVIGSAQFGMHYGMTNQIGKTSTEEVAQILQASFKAGADMIDTAPSYGDAEVVLGNVLNELSETFRLISKTRHFDIEDENDVSTLLKNDLHLTLTHLKASKLYALLFHHSEDLIHKYGDELIDAAVAAKDEGLIEKIGVSVYDLETLALILTRYPIDIVQCPMNFFDKRFRQASYSMQAGGIEVHARSVFLQGLLLDWQQLPETLVDTAKYFALYENYLKANNYSPIQGALLSVCPYVDKVLCGFNTLAQCQEVLRTLNHVDDSVLIDENLMKENAFQTLIDPRQW